jgi:acyl-CoA synthetase (NDP forming)
MLRFKVLVSAVPLMVAAILARVEFFPTALPCIALGSGSVEIASAPWHADLHVAFTDDPKLATVRVAITDDAGAADFAVVDDVDAEEDNACEPTPATQFIAISAKPSVATPVIYLSHDTESANYRIFVHSRRFSVREAAALIVGAHGQPPRLAAAAL